MKVELNEKEIEKVGYNRTMTDKKAFRALIPLGIGLFIIIIIFLIKEAAQTSSGKDAIEIFTMTIFGIGVGWTFCLLSQLIHKSNIAGKDLVNKSKEENINNNLS